MLARKWAWCEITQHPRWVFMKVWDSPSAHTAGIGIDAGGVGIGAARRPRPERNVRSFVLGASRPRAYLRPWTSMILSGWSGIIFRLSSGTPERLPGRRPRYQEAL